MTTRPWQDDPDFRATLEQAAECGAERALVKVGLGHATAGEDVRDLLSILGAWRTAKQIIWTTMLKTATKMILVAVLAGAALLFANGHLHDAFQQLRKD